MIRKVLRVTHVRRKQERVHVTVTDSVSTNRLCTFLRCPMTALMSSRASESESEGTLVNSPRRSSVVASSSPARGSRARDENGWGSFWLRWVCG